MDLVIDAQRPRRLSHPTSTSTISTPTRSGRGRGFWADYYGTTEYGNEASAQVYTSTPVGRQVLVRADTTCSA